MIKIQSQDFIFKFHSLGGRVFGDEKISPDNSAWASSLTLSLIEIRDQKELDMKALYIQLKGLARNGFYGLVPNRYVALKLSGWQVAVPTEEYDEKSILIVTVYFSVYMPDVYQENEVNE